MSYKHLFACGAIALALVSCNKELDQNQTLTGPVDGNAYVALNINLPSSTGTRASNDEFSDGTTNEYAVESIAIIFYKTDGTHVYTVADVPAPWTAEAPSTDEVTTRVKTLYEIDTDETELKVLVLINPLQNGYVAGDFDDTYAALAAKNFAVAPGSFNTNAFLMSNSPKYDGGWNNLVTVKTAGTEADALAAAKTVEVERTLAKVELTLNGTNFPGNKYTIPDGDSNAKDVITANAWDVDVVNTSSNLIRNYLDTWTTDPIVTNKRPYYSTDANFDAAGTYNILTTDPTIDFAANKVTYCHENTMDYDMQKLNETTSVLIKATYAPDAANIVKGSTETYTAGDWYMVGTGKTKYTFLGLKEAIVKALVAKGADETASKNAVDGLTNPTDGGSWIVSTSTETVTVGTVTYKLYDLMGNILYYKGGVCYYRVPIRHFTAEENGYTDEAAFKSAYTAANGVYAAKDLGRYGVVRNNWYKLTLNKISEPGTPAIVPPTSTNDDDYETFVACNIDILAWSIRNQGIEL